MLADPQHRAIKIYGTFTSRDFSLGTFYLRTANLLLPKQRSRFTESLTTMRPHPVNSRRHFSYAFHATANFTSLAHTVNMRTPLPVPACTTIRHFPTQPSRTPSVTHTCHHDCLMTLTVGTDCIHQCRHLLITACGNDINFLRTEPVARTTKIKVWLSVRDTAIRRVMDIVMQTLSCAEFGRISHQHI